MTIRTGSNPATIFDTIAINETLILAPGATAGALSTTFAGSVLINYGSLSGFNGGVAFEDNASGQFINMPGGSVVGTNLGVFIKGLGDVLNQGVILGAAQHGISVQSGANHNHIVNSGDVYGFLGGITVSAGTATDVSINNSGEIRSDQHGIWLLNATGAAPVIVNTGTITSPQDAILAQDGDRLNLTNFGLITGRVGSTSAGQADLVVNDGTIDGNVFLGSGDDTYRGSGIAHAVFGEAGANDISGGGGHDQFFGGNDNDTLSGNGGDDLLVGNGGDDILIGGPGADSLQGDLGDDLFGIDNIGDTVNDTGGTDTIASTISLGLAAFAGIENLTLQGNGAINGTGNGLANAITGNAAANLLDGGAAADQMLGGAGNDRYVVDNLGDVVSEAGGAGIDTVMSSINFSLAAALGKVENLTLTGAATINGTGNTLANVILGNARANILSGGAGNDRLAGGLGNDRLTGGAGLDKFVFDTKPGAANHDIITDFNTAADTFELAHLVFAKLGTHAGALNPSFFFAGPVAHDANDHVIYDQAHGNLFYDSNGNLPGGAVLIATLANHAALTASDFKVI